MKLCYRTVILLAAAFLCLPCIAKEDPITTRIYDIVVVGDEPGALSAMYVAARKKLNVAWVRTNENFSIPKIGEKNFTLCTGPHFRTAFAAFHLHEAGKTPAVLAAELNGITNLTQYIQASAGNIKYSEDGSILSYSFSSKTNGVITLSAPLWADGGMFGFVGDLAAVEARDLIEHRECEEGTIAVTGKFEELHFVPLGAFLVKSVPNVFVASRRFSATDEAKELMELDDETDAQAGAMAAYAAYSIKSLGCKLHDFASIKNRYLSLFWENVVKGGFGGGSMTTVGWDLYEMKKRKIPSVKRRPFEVLGCRFENGKYIIPAGDYYLEEPLVFTAADSGTPAKPVVYEAEGRVTLSAGRKITNWKIQKDGTWVADVPWAKKTPFRQLSSNGELRNRARHPNKGFLTAAKDNLPDDFAQAHGARWSLIYRQGDFNPNWKNPENGELISYVLWTDSHLKIHSVDAEANKINFKYPSAKALWGIDGKWWGIPLYRIENFLEIMDEPGEWYLNISQGRLHYRPMRGETPEKTTIVVPYHEHAVVFAGTVDAPCENITLKGVRISDARYDLPRGEVNDMQASVMVSAAVFIKNAKSVIIENCVIENNSGYGVEMRDGSNHCAVRRSILRHLGAGGVHIAGRSWESQMKLRCVGCEVSDSEIYDWGRDFASAVGVLQRVAEQTKIIHNHIHDGYYTGISCGWNWGYGTTSTRDNLIEGNHIHHIGKYLLSDMGGIYTLGVQSGTVLRGNHIHDVQVRAYGGWGIYYDEGSSGMLVEKNLVHDVKHGGYNINYGRGNTVRNNIFAFGEQYQIKLHAPNETHFNTYFYNNIVHWDSGPLMQPHRQADLPGITRLTMDYNLYSGAAAKPMPKQGPGKAVDCNSVWADAKFRDPLKRDFTLAPDSPAIALGFEPFDIKKAGPRK